MSENNGHKAGLRPAHRYTGFAKGYNRALDDARSRIESVLRGES